MLYPKPVKESLRNDWVGFSEITVYGPCTDLFMEAARLSGIKARIERDGIVELWIDRSLSGIEAYVIEIEETITIRGESEEGIARGIWTLLELARPAEEGWKFPKGRIEDSAFMGMRAVHLYLPPSDGIEECKRFFGMLARLKYNTVILEIGGGMEYERHPEVNRAWTKFCREAYRHTRGPQGLQASEAYWKDSTHVELAGGGFLRKSELRELVTYCKLLRMEVIPEIQALSHAYYLTLADRSIAERPYERWPDSYCPCNERSYELYGDCAEEILEVVRPKRVSIGHDEVRVLGECPKCREKSGAELLANDVNRLYEFYRKRGVKIMMWGEKLQNFENFKGVRTGGVEIPETIDRYGRHYSMPATYEAVECIPKDVLMLDWYYSQGDATEAEFQKKGFSEIFGNFAGSKIANWPERARRGNVLGAEVSTWCIPNEQEIGENGWFYELAYSAAVLWRDDYTDECRVEWDKCAEAMQPELKKMMRGECPFFDGTEKTITALYLPETGSAESVEVDEAALVGMSKQLADRFADNGLKCGTEFELGCKGNGLVFFHAAENPLERRLHTWFFLDPAPRIPASYAVDYADGLTLRIPVEFPNMVGALQSDGSYERPSGDAAISVDVDDDRKARQSRISPMYAQKDTWRSAAVYFSRAAVYTVKMEKHTIYAWEWKNPCPDKRIERVRLIDEEASPITLDCFGIGVV